jgi:D-alanyl-D-alanine carboxypeptidase
MTRKLSLTILAGAILAVFAATVTAPGTAAQAGDRTAKLQHTLDDAVAAGIPGAILLVRNGDQTIRLTSGYANVETKTRPRPADRFRVGSLTKTFVSAVILQLVGEHKLSLDDSVEKHLPGLVPNGKNISIRQLLNMKAGLFDYPNDPRVEGVFTSGDWAHKFEPRELVEIAVSHKPLFAPGKSWSYCNTCYIVAGLVVEKVTGRSIEAELKRRIFQPLHLTGTTLDSQQRIAGPHVHGYYRDGKKLLDTTLLTPSWGWAAGAIVSTADDIANFYRALARGQVVRPELLREMRKSVAAYSETARYGLGLADFPGPCGRIEGNGGDIIGYNSSAYGSKDGSRQYVLFLNLDEASFTKKIHGALDRIEAAAYCG